MADERINYNEAPAAATVETTDRGLFDFMKKKDEPSEAGAVASGIEKVHVSEPVECKEEVEKKHVGLVEKFHRSDSSSSSSSDEEGDDEEKKKRKKERKEKKAGLKEKIQEKLGGHKDEHDTNVPTEKIHVQENVYSEPSYTAPVHHPHNQEEENKGGFLDKIKEKLPGKHKDKADEHEVVAVEPCVEGDKEKKGFLDKIKDKIPGFHSKNGAEEKKDHEEKKEGY